MDNLSQLQLRKAFEVVYASLRLVGNVKSQAFGAFLENHALGFLDAVIRGDEKATRVAAVGLDYFLRLGAELGFVGYHSAEVVLGELARLDTAIHEQAGELKDQSDEFRRLFSGDLSLKFLNRANLRSLNQGEAMGKSIAAPIESTAEKVPNFHNPAMSGNTTEERNKAVGGDRTSAIIEKIRQSGYCRLSDLQGVLPDVSERTIRYDLERLSGQGLIERFGSGGPATYYRIKREIS